ncbi:unnamed protein product [Pieris brassicae]|uniref:C2H2-type domain-containing protein n=1 Tax=Pieris brassicae TaxID=7116 RepID=A0A9P0TPU9_PIEBR|nr:unnamed protein product [Pieris brassicae]
MNIEHKYNCVVCRAEFDFNDEHKANHKKLETHKQKLILYPHKEDFEENLIRQLDSETCYCTICGVSLSTHSLMRHLSAGVHKMELMKAKNRAYTYKPLE